MAARPNESTAARRPAVGADVDVRQAWTAVVTLYQGVLPHLVRALEEDAQLDSGVYSALAYLDRADPSGRLPFRELQELMHVRYSQPGLSRLVQRMEHEGFVDRHADPDDGRRTILVLTASGRRRLRAADEVYFAALGAHLGTALEPAEARDLAARVRAVAERVTRSGP